jgi:hypothetical protein
MIRWFLTAEEMAPKNPESAARLAFFCPMSYGMSIKGYVNGHD